MSESEREEGVEVRLRVPEMDCASCATKVEGSLDGTPGVESVDPRPASGTVVVTYDPAAADEAAVRGRIEAAGYAVQDAETATLSVPDMDCASCATKVEGALTGVAGVREVDPRPGSGRVSVTYDSDATDRGRLVAAVEAAGYAVEDDGGEAESPHAVWTSRRAIGTWIGGGLLLVGLALEFTPVPDPLLLSSFGREVTVGWLAFLLAAAVAGVPVLRNGYYSVRTRNLDIDLLMSAGILGALAVDLPLEAATLAVLFSVAELLEAFSMDRARSSLRELMDLSPETATVRRDGKEQVIPVDDVAVGERVLVRPGERVPIDGVVREGTSAVDESPITGESVPVEAGPDDEVYAGSIVEEGYLEVEATAVAGESTLARVVELVEDAEAERTERERFIDRFAAWYTPIVVIGAILTAAVPPLLGAPFERWFVRGLTLLVIACPCAFVISTPVSVVSGVTSAARNGVLIKGGRYLEAAGETDVVAFDKTGTLTTGELGVTDVVPLNGNDEDDLLGCAAALERRSEHPIARAIVAHADDRGVDDRTVEAFENITGRGVRADLDGTTHYAGKPGLFEGMGFDLEHAHVRTDGGRLTVEGDADDAGSRPTDEGSDLLSAAADCEHGAYVDLVDDVVPRLQAEGKTVVLVGTKDELEGVVAVADTVRPEAAWAVERLTSMGVRTRMLTGDNERTAQAIAGELGIDDVRADLLPEEKVEAIREAEAEGTVAMVGDGVNDAPALAAATVGVAMGAAGTDAALETADVALMADDLSRLPYLFDLSRRATRVIRTNVWSSLGVKALLAAGAPLGLVSVAAAVVVGDMGMSLAVTGNAMRLAGVEPEEPDLADG